MQFLLFIAAVIIIYLYTISKETALANEKIIPIPPIPHDMRKIEELLKVYDNPISKSRARYIIHQITVIRKEFGIHKRELSLILKQSRMHQGVLRSQIPRKIRGDALGNALIDIDKNHLSHLKSINSTPLEERIHAVDFLLIEMDKAMLHLRKYAKI